MPLQHPGSGIAEYFTIYLCGGFAQSAPKQEKRGGFAEDLVRSKSAPKTMRILRQPVQQGADTGGL